MYKKDLALNNQQGLICHKTKLTQRNKRSQRRNLDEKLLSLDTCDKGIDNHVG